MTTPRSRRDLILANATDLAADLVYYDRKEDEDLPRDSIEQAIAAGEITIDEIVEAFRVALVEGVGEDT